ncbi:glycosyltransferase [Candidatus Roizmanbacteria bacterium]|nr:glycosyltransferase [Candidatus Roizmanbacteria bacterium]
MKKAVIIIPTYNEEGNVEAVVSQIIDVSKSLTNWDLHILIVDSKSKDHTSAIVKDLQKKHKNLHLLETEKEGLGKAYINGFKYASQELKAYVVFEMDADLSHDPKDIPAFLKKIEEGADFVIGSRYIKGGSIPSNWAFLRKFYSVVGNLVLRLGFMKVRVTDWTSGYRAIKIWIVNSSLEHVNKYSGYVFQVALLDKAMAQHAIITELPINFKDRVQGVSKINAKEYMSQTLWYMFTHSSFIKFVFVGGIGFIIDFSISYVLIQKVHMKVWLATFISTESAIVANFLFNNFWSFAHKRVDNSVTAFLFGFLKFNLVSSGSVLIQTIGVGLLDAFFGQQYWYIYKIVIIAFVVIPYSYLFYNKFIWKDK